MAGRPRSCGFLPNVIQAIADLKDVNGSSLHSIEKCVLYKIQKKSPNLGVNFEVRKALKNGVDNGLFSCNRGKYKLAIDYDDLVKQQKIRYRRRKLSRRRRRRRRRYSSGSKSPSGDSASDTEPINAKHYQSDDGEVDDDTEIEEKKPKKPTAKRSNAGHKVRCSECQRIISKRSLVSRKSTKSTGRKSIVDHRSKSRKLDEANEQLKQITRDSKVDPITQGDSNSTVDMNRVNFKKRNDIDYKDSYMS